MHISGMHTVIALLAPTDHLCQRQSTLIRLGYYCFPMMWQAVEMFAGNGKNKNIKLNLTMICLSQYQI